MPKTEDGGLSVSFDADELRKYAVSLREVAKKTTPALSSALNEIGDQLVTVMAGDLSKRTGLAVDQVRGLMVVQRSSKSKLEYDITMGRRLFQPKVPDADLEEHPESRDFGRRVPGALVIVVTKHDELVCEECSELEALGAMPVEDAMRHVPAHPNCRCVIMPYVPKGRRLPVTMTTLTGAQPRSVDTAMTIRQMAKDILVKEFKAIKINLE